jgi:hypothetical protein
MRAELESPQRFADGIETSAEKSNAEISRTLNPVYTRMGRFARRRYDNVPLCRDVSLVRAKILSSNVP